MPFLVMSIWATLSLLLHETSCCLGEHSIRKKRKKTNPVLKSTEERAGQCNLGISIGGSAGMGMEVTETWWRGATGVTVSWDKVAWNKICLQPQFWHHAVQGVSYP